MISEEYLNELTVDIEPHEATDFLNMFSRNEFLLMCHDELPIEVIQQRVAQFRKNQKNNQDFWASSSYANQTI